MIALSEHRGMRLVVLCALYVAQGIPFGFLTVTLAAALAADGVDSGEIGGVFALGTLPWAFKWVWGPFVDRFGSTRYGRRRPWILAAQLGMVATLVGMWSIPDPATSLVVLGGWIVAHNIFNSLQDVCVDALAIDLLPPEDRGKASGLMYGSKYAGTAIGGGGLSILAGTTGLHGAFAGMVVLVAAIALLPLFTVERPGERRWPGGPLVGAAKAPVPDDHEEAPEAPETPETPEQPVHSVLGLLHQLALGFANRAALATAAVALLATTASGMLSPIGTVLFVRDFGWSQEEYGAVTGGAGIIAGLVGAVSGGFLADLVGPRRIVAMCSVVLALLLVAFGLGMNGEIFQIRSVIWSYVVAEAFLLGCINAAFFAVCFGICRPAVAATQFTAFMALMNFGVAGAQGLAGTVETHLGVSGAWLLGGVIQFSVALLMPFTLSKRGSQTENAIASG